MDNRQKNFGEDRTCSSGDMIADRETHTHTQTDRQTDTFIAILRSPIGGGVSICAMQHGKLCRNMLMQEVMVFYLFHAIVRIGRTMNVSIKFPTFFAKKSARNYYVLYFC